MENIVTLDGTDSHEDVDVQARIVDLTTPVYKIDIAWGNMKFVFSPDDFAGTWNPVTQTYDNPVAAGWSGFEDGNNEIMVWNHSNADVNVSFTVTEVGLAPNVTMAMLKDNDGNGTVATNLMLGKVPRPTKEALKVSAYLRLDGTSHEDDMAKLESDAWHRIGIITVTITPDGDTLTPR